MRRGERSVVFCGGEGSDEADKSSWKRTDWFGRASLPLWAVAIAEEGSILRYPGCNARP
jgi:hypothetical protein